MPDPHVLLERDGAVSIVTFNRPQRRNGVTIATCHELYETLRAVAASDARVLVLRGAGTDFCVGADLKGAEPAATEAPATPNTLAALGAVYHAATLLHEMPQVTIAAIDGGCAGAGLGWACACDFRFATPEARFATAFLNVGAAGDMGLGWTLPRIVGPARARELLLLPEKLTGEQALAIGLVTRLFARVDLHDEAMALANELAARDPFALRMMKANLVSGETLDFRQFIEIESARHLHITAQPQFGSRFAVSAETGKPSPGRG